MANNGCARRRFPVKARLLRPGNAEAEGLVLRHQGLVYMTARRFFPQRLQDQDLLQCGLIGLWEATRIWCGDGEFMPFARHCILNNMRDYLRGEHRAAPATDCQAREADHGYEDETIDRLDMLWRIKNAWPENSRERYVLIALSKGISKQSVAAALGVQYQTVCRIAKRALEGLEPEDAL